MISSTLCEHKAQFIKADTGVKLHVIGVWITCIWGLFVGFGGMALFKVYTKIFGSVSV